MAFTVQHAPRHSSDLAQSPLRAQRECRLAVRHANADGFPRSLHRLGGGWEGAATGGVLTAPPSTRDDPEKSWPIQTISGAVAAGSGISGRSRRWSAADSLFTSGGF